MISGNISEFSKILLWCWITESEEVFVNNFFWSYEIRSNRITFPDQGNSGYNQIEKSYQDFYLNQAVSGC